MPPLPLANALHNAFPRLSSQGRAVVSTLVCLNGHARRADEVAAWVGLHDRHQLARLLRRDGLPPIKVLAAWVRLLHWLLQAETTGASLLQLARRDGLDPAVAYRLVQHLTGRRWSQLQRDGLAVALCRFRDAARPPGAAAPPWIAEPSRRLVAAVNAGAAFAPAGATLTHASPESPAQDATPPGRLPLPGGPFSVAIHPAGWAYITRVHAAAVERLDVATRRRAGSIPVGSVPTCLALSPDGRRAYVSIQYGNEIAVIDTGTHERIRTIPVRGDPFPVVVGANGAIVYVTTNEDRLHALCARTGRTLGVAALRATGHSLALHPAGNRLYVSTRVFGSVVEVDALRLTALRTFALGGWTQGLVLSPDGCRLYVANERDGINVVHLPTGRLVTTVPLEGGACSLALSPDERLLCAGLVHAGRIAIIDSRSLTVVATVTTRGRPRGIAFDAPGNVAVVANEAGWVDLLTLPNVSRKSSRSPHPQGAA
jgi:YVTN family beta-propeller protein